MSRAKFIAATFTLSVHLILIGCGGGGTSTSTPGPAPNPDFSISGSTTSTSVEQGATSGPVIVSVTGQNGFSGSVSISVDGLPTGVTSSPASPFSVAAGTSQQVTFSASNAATTGSVMVTFRGTSGALTHTASLTLAVTQPPFAINTSVSNLSLCVGCSHSLQVTASGGSSSDMVSLTASAPGPVQGAVSASFSPTAISPGGNATLTVNINTSAAPFLSFPLTVTGTRSGDNMQQTLDIQVATVIGGGTLHIVPRTTGDFAIPANSVPYITKFVSQITAPGMIYDLCGSATDTRTTEVILNPAEAGHTYFEAGLNGANNLIHLGALPNPGPDGVDLEFNHVLAHEVGNTHHGLWIGLNEPTFNTTDEFQADPLAETCAVLVLKQLAQSGTIPSETVNEGFETTLLIDTLARYNATTLAGNRYKQPYDTAFQEAGEGFYRLLVGPNGFPTLAAYEDSFFAAMNAKGGLLAPADFQTFLNQATIDGMGAGDWCAAHMPLFLQMPTSASGTGLIVWTFTPNIPYSLLAQAFTEGMTGGDFSSAPISSGKVAVTVFDGTGLQVSSFATDLADTVSPGNPFVINLQNSLSAGAYNLRVSASANGGTVTSEMPLVVVPPAFYGPYSPNMTGTFYVYAISVDGNGNAINGTLSVTEGTTVNSGNGYVVIEAGSSGEIIVNGRKFTAPPTGSRVVFVQAQ